MNNGFSEIGAFNDDGLDARHFFCDDFHLWTWVDSSKDIVKFEFAYNAWAVKYAQGEFSRGTENYINAMFIIMDERFNVDAELRSRLLAIRDDYNRIFSVPIEAMGSLDELDLPASQAG
jgi:hypothetical protein